MMIQSVWNVLSPGSILNQHWHFSEFASLTFENIFLIDLFSRPHSFDGVEQKGLDIHEDAKEYADGLEKYLDISITAELKKDELKDDTHMKCVLRIPDSTYEKIAQQDYDGMPISKFFIDLQYHDLF